MTQDIHEQAPRQSLGSIGMPEVWDQGSAKLLVPGSQDDPGSDAENRRKLRLGEESQCAQTRGGVQFGGVDTNGRGLAG